MNVTHCLETRYNDDNSHIGCEYQWIIKSNTSIFWKTRSMVIIFNNFIKIFQMEKDCSKRGSDKVRRHLHEDDSIGIQDKYAVASWLLKLLPETWSYWRGLNVCARNIRIVRQAAAAYFCIFVFLIFPFNWLIKKTRRSGHRNALW